MDLWSAMGKAIWGEPTQDAEGNVSETERALSAVRGFSTLGLLAVALFGAAASPDGFQQSLRGIATALIAATGAFGVGGLLGFMFGVPRWDPAAAGASAAGQPPGGGAAGNAATGKGDAKPPAGSPAAVAPGALVPNTGLYKIVDWLTTLIVGLGLVHLRTAWEYGTSISIWLTAEIVAPGTGHVANGSPGAAILIVYSIAGFFLAFLWALRYMGGELQDAHGLRKFKADITTQLDADKVATKSQINSLLGYAAKLAATPAGGVAFQAASQPYASSSIEDLRIRGLDASIADELARAYAASSAYDDEPLARFGSVIDSRNGRRLEGSVARAGEGLQVFDVTLRVTSTDPQKPLAGDVAFLLHHTLPPVARIVAARNNEAVLTVQCIGTFVAGAVVIGESTRLAFDLSSVPGAPPEFLEN